MRKGYDYLEQVNRYHNLVDWKKKSLPMAVSEQSSLSLDEMNARWKAYDWLIADDKHWEGTIIKHIDKQAAQQQKKQEWAERKQEWAENKAEFSTPIVIPTFITNIAKGEW